MIWQRTRRGQLEQLIRSAKTDFAVDEGCLERVVRAIATAPAPPPARSRRRVIAAAAVALAALVALGFVPFPAGSASGALGRAIAAFETTSGFYMRAREVRHRDIKDRMTEVWEAPGGLLRIAYWEEGRLQSWQLRGADFQAYCNPAGQFASVYDLPPAHSYRSPYQSLGPIRDMVASRKAQTGTTAVREWRQRSLWGSESDVIEATEPLEGPDQGWRRMRWEVDAATGRLISEKHWWMPHGGAWELVAYTEEVTWDVDIPSDTWAFVPPEGWKVRYYRWWTGRVENTLANGHTRDWQVTVHAVDADRNGDLVITTSRTPTAGAQDRTWPDIPMEIEAVDNLGVTYRSIPDPSINYEGAPDYQVTALRRSGSAIPPGQARTLSLTVRPYPDEAYAGQALTFAGLSIPPLQDQVDAQTQLVQY